MYSYLKVSRNFLINWRYIHNSKIIEKHKKSLGLWHLDITTDIKLKIEDHWAKEVVSSPEIKENVDTYYVLPMFPYPSGNLHMGHVRVYSISDTIARFHKLNGKNIIHPIGWDAFGLPAENAAIERNILPHHWTQTNIDSMKQQLKSLKYNFDWNRELSTCDPQYYKWTQYIFLKLFEKGLAYQCKAKVNWDPIDRTVLADEQVDEFGCSWRSGAKVESKILTQWFIKTTKYAKKLYDGLKSESLEDWKDIINLQRHWIGECNGIVVTFKIKLGDEFKSLDIWTSDPYKFIYGEFITMSNNNILLHGIKLDNSSLKCLNPITDQEMPVYVTDSANYAPERDVYIASPALDEEDFKLAKTLNIPLNINKGITCDKEKENQHAIEIAQRKCVGGHYVSSKLKDWLISRQRYWGTPIPIVHCTKCGTVPVPFEDLPVELPIVEAVEPGIQVLANLDDWVNCKCPKCQSNAKRETDTMDTFVDSSWYYYRFLDPSNKEKAFDKKHLVGKTPINVYIGGKEHAVLHLYYARFMSYFLHSLGWTPSEEPFKKLVVQGMVMGQSYKLKSSGKYLQPNDVEKVGNEFKDKTSGESVLVQWEKMSKSKYNGENPERLLSEYGSDTTKLLMLADVPPATSRRWSDATLPGVLNWQHRLWLTLRDFLKYRTSNVSKTIADVDFKKHESKILDARNYYTATATYHFKYTYKLSVGISRLQSLTSTLRNNVPAEVIAYSKEYEQALASLIIMLSPVTPHFSSELWAGFLSAPNRVSTHLPNYIDWEKSVLDQHWPEVDDDYNLSFLCKVDGADRCEIKIKSIYLKEINQETALGMMINKEPVAKWIKTNIIRTKFELYPGCRAILHISTNRQQKVKKSDTKVKVSNS
ncbi:leucine--tRNA ligase, mitochondrial [Ostrinia nubilalis]|uniref:leucine--tRNA ligase, mitochondrial n=1 Tax=Ostrinia nubilalis TaxID=29057 RepID=UPI0030823487